jgi:ABC-type dipeptide/oligopeptide/nickel transport system permease component
MEALIVFGALALFVCGFVAGVVVARKKQTQIDAALAKADRIKSAIED